jgi:hypothetical protein
MRDDIASEEPHDGERAEIWTRTTDEPKVLGVSAWEWSDGTLGGHTVEPSWGQVSVSVAEHLSGPLEDELREGIAEVLWDVPGVTDVSAGEDPDIWEIDGDPSGEALVRAAADAVDRMAERVRDYLRSA